jgi:RNA polymerase sigma-70 factor (ECF subfamily)
MDSRLGRSKGVGETAIASAEHPGPTELDFERLYRSSRDDVYGYAAGLLRDRSAAEDVTALAFERAFRKRTRFDPRRGSARAWLFGIARNAALDELRRRGRQTKLHADPVDAASVGIDQSRHELRMLVDAALDRLDARERELVVLKFFAGLSNGEIAAVVGISASNVGTRLNRTMDKLREACDGAL